MCNILCCFGCLTCIGCRDRVCQRLVFFPPRTMYTVEVDEKKDVQTMWLLDERRQKTNPYTSPNFRVDFVKTKKNNEIAVMFIRSPKSKTTILFSHGNATDIGCMRDHLVDMSSRLRVNVCTYDYSGYGLSSGKPSMSNTFSDVESCFIHITTKFISDPLHNIIVYGQSLGSGPTLYLAQKYKVSGVVLHSGMMSALRVIRNLEKTKWFDIYPNIDRVKTNESPIFVIHGTMDQEIPLHHGIALAENALNPYTPWFVEGAGHNNVEIHWREEYFEKLSEFVRGIETKKIKSRKEKLREKIKNDDIKEVQQSEKAHLIPV